MPFKNPAELADALDFVPFKLDKEKYPDVEETPYGFIYNVGGRSITDIGGQNRKFGMGRPDATGFTVEFDGDESFYPDFELAYKAAKGIK